MANVKKTKTKNQPQTIYVARGGCVRTLLVYIYDGGPYFKFLLSPLLYVCIHTHNKNDLMFTKNKIKCYLEYNHFSSTPLLPLWSKSPFLDWIIAISSWFIHLSCIRPTSPHKTTPKPSDTVVTRSEAVKHDFSS